MNTPEKILSQRNKIAATLADARKIALAIGGLGEVCSSLEVNGALADSLEHQSQEISRLVREIEDQYDDYLDSPTPARIDTIVRNEDVLNQKMLDAAKQTWGWQQFLLRAIERQQENAAQAFRTIAPFAPYDPDAGTRQP